MKRMAVFVLCDQATADTLLRQARRLDRPELVPASIVVALVMEELFGAACASMGAVRWMFGCALEHKEMPSS